MRLRRHRAATFTTSALVAGALFSLALAPGAEVTPPGSGADPPPAGHPAVANFGAFLDSGLLGVKRIPALEKWLGGADIRVGHTYLAGNTWSDIEGRAGFLDDWASWRTARADRTLVLNVPMQALNEAEIPDGRVRQLLAKGAAGSSTSTSHGSPSGWSTSRSRTR